MSKQKSGAKAGFVNERWPLNEARSAFDKKGVGVSRAHVYICVPIVRQIHSRGPRNSSIRDLLNGQFMKPKR